jgi:soluble lytic murein transglycosylase-like protein
MTAPARPAPGRRKPRRKPRKTARKAARSAGSAPAWARLALGAGAAVLLLALPPVRRAAAGAWHAVEKAAAESRRREAREREITQWARRYGISHELADAIERAARAEEVETELAFRLVRVESAFDEDALSPVGAVGLTQVMPATAAELRPGITPAQLRDRDTNLRLGLRYLRRLLSLYDGDREEALHAYNRGMGTVARIRATGGDPANGYARRVLGPAGLSPVRRAADTTSLPPPAPAHELAPALLPAGM